MGKRTALGMRQRGGKISPASQVLAGAARANPASVLQLIGQGGAIIVALAPPSRTNAWHENATPALPVASYSGEASVCFRQAKIKRLAKQASCPGSACIA
jgi:hypothetical protein